MKVERRGEKTRSNEGMKTSVRYQITLICSQTDGHIDDCPSSEQTVDGEEDK